MNQNRVPKFIGLKPRIKSSKTKLITLFTEQQKIYHNNEKGVEIDIIDDWVGREKIVF